GTEQPLKRKRPTKVTIQDIGASSRPQPEETPIMVEQTSPMKKKKKAKKTKSQIEEVISPSKTITEETSSKPKGKKSK
ncbi:hypothetical protein A2U01_0055900, partial [Trifolium medium]|nr:hypothetical protein [Trifolium medium]